MPKCTYFSQGTIIIAIVIYVLRFNTRLCPSL